MTQPENMSKKVKSPDKSSADKTAFQSRDGVKYKMSRSGVFHVDFESIENSSEFKRQINLAAKIVRKAG